RRGDRGKRRRTMTRLVPPVLELKPPASRSSNYEVPVIVREPAPGIMADSDKARLDRRSAFARQFIADPISAVKGLTQDVLRHYVDPEEAAGFLVPYLVKASY